MRQDEIVLEMGQMDVKGDLQNDGEGWVRCGVVEGRSAARRFFLKRECVVWVEVVRSGKKLKVR